MKTIVTLLASFLVINCVFSQQNTYPWPQSGNIGIGTSSPQSLLNINGGKLSITNFPNSDWGAILTGSNGAGNYLKIAANTASLGPEGICKFESWFVDLYYGRYTSNQKSYGLYLNAKHTDVAAAFMGKVGIGTDIPNYILDVNGTARVSSDAILMGKVGIGTISPLYNLDVTGTTRITALSGSGSRMVVADLNGVLGTQAIPSGGGSGLNYKCTQNIELNGHYISADGNANGITVDNIGYVGINGQRDSRYALSVMQGYSYFDKRIGIARDAPDPAALFNANLALQGDGVAFSGSWLISTTLPANKNIKFQTEGLEQSLNRLSRLNCNSYIGKGMNGENDEKFEIDFKSFQEQFPSLVKTDGTNNYFDYLGLIPVLVKSISEQQEIINNLQLKLEQINLELVSFDRNHETSRILFQNEPNPGNSFTIIRFKLIEGDDEPQIIIKDANGRTADVVKISSFNDTFINYNLGNLTNGSYFYSLVTNGLIRDTKKMIINK